MKIVILHNEVTEDASADARDVLVQREAVAAALGRSGTYDAEPWLHA